jgi:hypothetical protein
LRLREAFENNRLDGTRRIGDEVRQGFAFDLGERFKHVYSGVFLAGWAPHPDTNAQEISTDVVDGRTDTVLAAVTAARLDSNGVEVKVDVVVNHDDVVGVDAEELCELPDGPTRHVHETHQRRKNNPVGARSKSTLGDHRDGLVTLWFDADLLSEAVDHAVTDGMAMRGVVRPGVTKPDYEPRIGHDYSADSSAAGAASAIALEAGKSVATLDGVKVREFLSRQDAGPFTTA